MLFLQFSSWTGFISSLPSLASGLSIVSLFFVFLHLVSIAAIDLINGNVYCPCPADEPRRKASLEMLDDLEKRVRAGDGGPGRSVLALTKISVHNPLPHNLDRSEC